LTPVIGAGLWAYGAIGGALSSMFWLRPGFCRLGLSVE
jgi:hypothetical protein